MSWGWNVHLDVFNAVFWMTWNFWGASCRPTARCGTTLAVCLHLMWHFVNFLRKCFKLVKMVIGASTFSAFSKWLNVTLLEATIALSSTMDRLSLSVKVSGLHECHPFSMVISLCGKTGRRVLMRVSVHLTLISVHIWIDYDWSLPFVICRFLSIIEMETPWHIPMITSIIINSLWVMNLVVDQVLLLALLQYFNLLSWIHIC